MTKLNINKHTITEKIGFNIIDFLTNGNYINGITAGEIAEKLSPEILHTVIDEIEKEIKKKEIKTSSGKCPTCNPQKGREVLGRGHFPDAEEHYSFVNYGLSQILTLLNQMKGGK